LKEEALHRTMWRHRFGGGFGPVVRQNTEWMNEWLCTVKLTSKLHNNFNVVVQFVPVFFSAATYLAKYSFIPLEFESRFEVRSSLFSKSFLKVPIFWTSGVDKASANCAAWEESVIHDGLKQFRMLKFVASFFGLDSILRTRGWTLTRAILN